MSNDCQYMVLHRDSDVEVHCTHCLYHRNLYDEYATGTDWFNHLTIINRTNGRKYHYGYKKINSRQVQWVVPPDTSPEWVWRILEKIMENSNGAPCGKWMGIN